MDKKGVFMGLYLVFLTLFMCGAAAILYIYQSGDLANELVSPVPILELQDRQEIFEMQEYSLIIDSATGEKDAEKIKQDFCTGFSNLNSSFLFENLVFEGRSDWGNAFSTIDSKNNFCSRIYSFEFKDSNLVVKRSNLGKAFRLKVADRKRINFPMGVSYNFDKTYVIPGSKII